MSLLTTPGLTEKAVELEPVATSLLRSSCQGGRKEKRRSMKHVHGFRKGWGSSYQLEPCSSGIIRYPIVGAIWYIAKVEVVE